MIKYRFKTEEEFLEEFGERWRREIKMSWVGSGEMDYLLGKPLDSFEYERNVHDLFKDIDDAIFK